MRICILTGLLFFCSNIFAQHITPENYTRLANEENSLKVYAKKMILDSDAVERFRADSIFIKGLVQALRINNSFYYPFDSIITVSKLYSPDSAFRIFTWQLRRDDAYFRQYGAIQMHTADGSIKVFPLLDISDFASVPTDSVRTNNNWIGAIYYNMVMKEYQHKKYYTLLGYDENDFATTKKWMEVLQFDEQDKPVFGGTFFDYPKDSIKPDQPAYRFCLEYRKEASVKLNYDAEMDMVVFEHLISESNEPHKKYTLIPDGDYEGFKWKNGKWVYVDKVFDFKLKDGEEPVPQPLFNDDGSRIPRDQ